MFIGYGTLHQTEIFNNQRTLDYLAGDPDRGIAGMASAFSTIRRSSSPSTATHLFCDPPVRLGSFSVKMEVSGAPDEEDANGYTITRYVAVASLLDDSVAVELIDDGALYQVKRFTFSHSVAGGARPAIPALDDVGWVDVGVGDVPLQASTGAVPSIPDPCDDTSYGPYYEHWRIRPVGGSEVAEFFIYIDACKAVDTIYGAGVTTNASDAGGTSLPRNATATVAALGPDPTGRYTTPAQDDAPWYDAGVPESGEFAGLYVEEITGFDSLVNRSVNDGALMGATLGPLTMKGRAMTVTGWLQAATCAGAEYGLHWLAEALAGTNACDDCSVGDLVMIKSVPPSHNSSPVDYLRVMHHVGLVDGPKVVDRSGTCCSECGSTSLKVQFTLTSELPYIFSDVDWIVHDEPFTEGPFDYDLSLPCRRSEACNETNPVIDLGCGPDLPPAPPPVVLADGCYCEPWQTMRLGAEFINTRQWNSATTYIEVKAGESDVRNVKIVAFHNPQDLDCPLHYEADDRWMCTTPCASVAVSRVPAGGTLIIDSRTRSVNLMLPGGGSVSGLRFLSTGDDTGPFDWFDISQCTRICLVASIEEQVSDDATISIGVVNRFLASGG